MKHLSVVSAKKLQESKSDLIMLFHSFSDPDDKPFFLLDLMEVSSPPAAGRSRHSTAPSSEVSFCFEKKFWRNTESFLIYENTSAPLTFPRWRKTTVKVKPKSFIVSTHDSLSPEMIILKWGLTFSSCRLIIIPNKPLASCEAEDSSIGTRRWLK